MTNILFNFQKISHSSGLLAYFVDTFITAMNLRLVPMNMEPIEKELDILGSFQREDGSFDYFGSFPDYNSKNPSSTRNYFETAFVLIPFLKARGFTNKSYEVVINKALEFLIEREQKFTRENEALSVTAYVYALCSKNETDNSFKYRTKHLLDQIELAKIEYNQRELCFKIKVEDGECDIRQTAYAAMAYLGVNEIQNALPLIRWLAKFHNEKVAKEEMYTAAVMAEPIADVASYLLSAAKPNFSVTVTDEFDFNEILWINETTSSELHKIILPTHSQKITFSFNGHGFCSLTYIHEHMMEIIPAIEPAFDVNINTTIYESSNKVNEKVFRVCATYLENNYQPMHTVIYEVDLPSGYVYNGIMDEDEKRKKIKVKNFFI